MTTVEHFEFVVLQVCVGVLAIILIWNLVTINRTLTTLWEIVKDLQMRKDFH